MICIVAHRFFIAVGWWLVYTEHEYTALLFPAYWDVIFCNLLCLHHQCVRAHPKHNVVPYAILFPFPSVPWSLESR